MIKSFRHKGLQRFFASGSKAGIIPDHATRLRVLLTDLNAVARVDDLDTPGYRMHQLTEDEAGRWSVTVRANRRITFEYVDGDAYIVDYEDYH